MGASEKLEAALHGKIVGGFHGEILDVRDVVKEADAMHLRYQEAIERQKQRINELLKENQALTIERDALLLRLEGDNCCG